MAGFNYDAIRFFDSLEMAYFLGHPVLAYLLVGEFVEELRRSLSIRVSNLVEQSQTDRQQQQQRVLIDGDAKMSKLGDAGATLRITM